MPITPARRRRYEKLLKQAREQAMLVVAATSSGGESRTAFHGRKYSGLEDCALIEQEIDALLAEQESDTLAAIDRALRMLQHEPEVFGRCEECGEEIATDWLDVAPWLSRCADHAGGVVAF